MIFELAQDFAATVAAMPQAHPRRRMLRLLEEALRRDVHFIARHPTTLFQCMWNTCWWYDCPEASEHYVEPTGGWTEQNAPWLRREGRKLHVFLESWRAAREGLETQLPWLRSHRPPPVPLGTGLVAVLRGHGSPISAIAACPPANGPACVAAASRPVSLSARGAETEVSIQIWDIDSGRQVRCLSGHKAMINAVAFSPCGRFVASGSGDPGIGIRDYSLRIWDVEAGTERLCLADHRAPVLSVAFSPDGRLVASASTPGSVREGDWSSPGGESGPDDREVGTLRVWDATCGRLVRQCEYPGARVLCAAFSLDGTRMASGWNDGVVRVWNLASGDIEQSLSAHHGEVNSLAFSPDGEFLATVSTEEACHLWDLRTAELQRSFGDGGRSVAFAADGRRLAVELGCLTVWDTATGDALVQQTSEGGLYGCAFLAGDKCICCGSPDGAVRVFALERDSPIPRLVAPRGEISLVTFPEDPECLCCVTAQGTMSSWNVGSGKCLTIIAPGTDEEAPFNVAAVSYDRRRFLLAAHGTGRPALLVDNHGDIRARVSLSQGWVIAADFSLDGTVATAWTDGTVRIWDADTGGQLACFDTNSQAAGVGRTDWNLEMAQPEPVTCAAFSRDGSRLAVGRGSVAGSHGVQIWDLSTCRCLGLIAMGDRTVGGLRFTATGEQLVVAGFDSRWTGRLDLRTRRLVDSIEAETDTEAWAAGAGRFPFQILAFPSEACVRGVRTGIVQAWFPWPIRQLATGLDGRTWAGAVAMPGCRGWELSLLALEDAICDPDCELGTGILELATLFLDAVRNGDRKRVEALARRGVDPNTKDTGGVPALLHAVILRWPEVVNALLKLGASLDASTPSGWSAMMQAVGTGQADLVEQFLARGVMPDAGAVGGRTPLMTAIHCGLAKDGSACLSTQLARGRTRIVKALLLAGANPNSEAAGQAHPLTRAVGFGSTPDCTTAISDAAAATRTDVVEALLAAGADPEGRISDGLSPLMTAVCFRTRSYLLRPESRRDQAGGAEDSAASVPGNLREQQPSPVLPMSDAVAFSRMRVAELLLKAGADPNRPQPDGWTPLAAALHYEVPDMIQLLQRTGFRQP